MIITFEQAIQYIQEGKVIAVPTDTVYGLAACIDNEEAIKEVFKIKKRPATKPLVVQVATWEQAEKLITHLPSSFSKIRTLWPGPLTIVFDANVKAVTNIVRAKGPTVAIRISDHELLRNLIAKTGPLAIPSANISSQPAATNAKEVCNTFGNDFPVLDGGECAHGSESTIIRLTDKGWKILREGVISYAKIKKTMET